MRCPNCNSEENRLQLALDLQVDGEMQPKSSEKICCDCGFRWAADMPLALVMIIAAARKFPNEVSRKRADRFWRGRRFRNPSSRGQGRFAGAYSQEGSLSFGKTQPAAHQLLLRSID